MTDPTPPRAPRFYPGRRVRIDLPRPDYPRRGEPLPLASRGTVLASDCTVPALEWHEGNLVPNPAAPDPATIRYTVRLDTGDVLVDVEGARLDSERTGGYDHDPRERLRERYATTERYGFASPELIAEVFYNERRRLRPDDYLGPPEIAPTDEDVLDALACLADARSDLDLYERCLLDWARDRGITWETIGLTLGYKPEGARSGAQGRRARLKRKAAGR